MTDPKGLTNVEPPPGGITGCGAGPGGNCELPGTVGFLPGGGGTGACCDGPVTGEVGCGIGGNATGSGLGVAVGLAFFFGGITG